jgi:hypothetical protein
VVDQEVLQVQQVLVLLVDKIVLFLLCLLAQAEMAELLALLAVDKDLLALCWDRCHLLAAGPVAQYLAQTLPSMLDLVGFMLQSVRTLALRLEMALALA